MSMETAQQWTDRKRQVLELIARGKTNAEIADALGVSLAGAKWHVSEVLSVLGVESREQAAAYWREQQALSRRLSRGFRALLGPALSWKAAAGGTGMAAIAGGVIVVAGLSSDGVQSPDTTSTATPTVWTLEDIEFVPVITAQLADGNSVTLLASLGPQLMIRPEHSRDGFDNVYRSHDLKADFEPSVFMGFGNQQVGLFYGSTSLDADHVELSLYDGRTIAVPLVDLPPELEVKAKFWAYEFDPRSLVGEMRAVAKDGTILDRQTIFQPPGYLPSPGQTRSGPLSELILVGSGRPDAHLTPNPFGHGQPGSIANPAGGEYRFRVEHDGTRPLALVFWCQTGVLPLTWLEGPDTAGNGVFSAQVPPNSAGCFFREAQADGNYRITALPRP